MHESINVLLRAIFAYFTLFILTRIMGKREISQITFFDYIVGITIGSIAANISVNLTTNFVVMIPALLVFAVFQIISSYISLKNKTFRKLSEGTKRLLIDNGNIIEKNMLKERLNMDELETMLRKKNIFRLSDVEFAFLETDGKLSVMKKPEKQPVTPSDLKIVVENNGLGQLVIEEGNINDDVLRRLGITRSWLINILSQQNITDPQDVMFAQIDDSGKVYIDLYDHKKNETL